MGNHFLDPGWTRYDKEAQYVTFDVTDNLQPGENVLGVMLGNGFYNVPNERYFKITGSFGAPRMRMLMKVVYDDGDTEFIASDGSWRVTASPVTYSSIYSGEDYDATRLIEGWMLPGYNDRDWKKPVVRKDGPAEMYCAPGTQLRVIQELPVTMATVTPEGNNLYDFGQNFSGTFRIKVRGKKGDKIVIRPAEHEKEGRASQSGTGSPVYYNYTIGRDSVEETWQPQFTYFGQRFIQIDGAVPQGSENPDGLPEIVEITGLHTSAAPSPSGSFTCSNPLFNKIHTLIDWAVRSNTASVLTDCPHREKLGWQEEAHLMQHSLMYRYDLSRLYPKIMRDLKAAQHDNGCMPTIAPQYVVFNEGFGDTPEWGSSSILSPWYYYKWYGDDTLLREFYPEMQRYADYLQSKAEDNIISYGLGDWYDIGPNPPGYAQLTSNGLTATAIYYSDINVLKEATLILGKTEDAERYARLANDIKAAYNQKFFNDSCGYYDRGSQTANAISLVTGLAEGEMAEKALDALVADIENRGYALTAGDVGYKYVLEALTRGGRAETVFRMNNRYDTPGYGWQLAHGATALTESWQAYDFASNNHFMLGHIMEWLYSALGGIGQTEDSTGFRTAEIAPLPCGDITAATTGLETPYGKIETDWHIDGDIYTLNVTVPGNASAVVWLPSADLTAISEHGIPLRRGNIKGIRSMGTSGDKTRLHIGSGSYSFRVP